MAKLNRVQAEEFMERFFREMRRMAKAAGIVPPRTWSVTEAARELGISVATLRSLIRASAVLVIRVGGQRRIPLTEMKRAHQLVPHLRRTWLGEARAQEIARTHRNA